MDMDIGSSLIQFMLVTIIQALLPILLGFVVVWIKAQIKSLKAKAEQDKLAFAAQLARQLVMAAEQSGLSGALDNLAETKKTWVLQRLEAELAKNKIYLDLEMLSDLVEAQVMDVFTQNKLSTNPLEWLYEQQ